MIRTRAATGPVVATLLTAALCCAVAGTATATAARAREPAADRTTSSGIPVRVWWTLSESLPGNRRGWVATYCSVELRDGLGRAYRDSQWVGGRPEDRSVDASRERLEAQCRRVEEAGRRCEAVDFGIEPGRPDRARLLEGHERVGEREFALMDVSALACARLPSAFRDRPHAFTWRARTDPATAAADAGAPAGASPARWRLELAGQLVEAAGRLTVQVSRARLVHEDAGPGPGPAVRSVEWRMRGSRAVSSGQSSSAHDRQLARLHASERLCRTPIAPTAATQGMVSGPATATWREGTSMAFIEGRAFDLPLPCPQGSTAGDIGLELLVTLTAGVALRFPMPIALDGRPLSPGTGGSPGVGRTEAWQLQPRS